MKKDSIKKLASFVTFMLLLALSFNGMAKILATPGESSMNGMEQRISYAYRGEDRNSVDVFFVGNSDMYRGFSPLDFYNDQKITSTICGKPKADMKMMYESIDEMFKYQKPKVVVVEVDSFYAGTSNAIPKDSKGETTTKFAGVIPNKISVEKAAKKVAENSATKQATKKAKKNEPQNLSERFEALQKTVKDGDSAILSGLNYLSPLVKYHDNWKHVSLSNLIGADKKFYSFPSKGMVFSDKIKPISKKRHNYMERRYLEGLKILDSNLEVFDKMNNLCRENDAELVLLAIPSASSWSNQKSAEVAELAKKYGLKFYDYNVQQPVGFDWKLHTKDAGNHLNYAGACVMTKDFGQVLAIDCNLTPTKLTDEQSAQWVKDFQQFREKFNIVS